MAFRGTRVPVAALFENFEGDASVHEFVDWFAGVTMTQAGVVLEYAAPAPVVIPVKESFPSAFVEVSFP